MDREVSSPPPFKGSSPSRPPNPPAANDAAPDAQPTFMSIKFVDQQQGEMWFRIKPITKLSKVMDAFCERQGLNRQSLRFIFGGERIVDADTPLALEMMDGDAVHVFTEQFGGGPPSLHSPDSNQSPPAKPPNVAGGGEATPEARRAIEIKLVDIAKNELVFKLRPTTKLDRVMDGYCKHNGKAPHSTRFLFDGKRVVAGDTPDLLEMEDGDVIDVMEEVVGGG